LEHETDTSSKHWRVLLHARNKKQTAAGFIFHSEQSKNTLFYQTATFLYNPHPQRERLIPYSCPQRPQKKKFQHARPNLKESEFIPVHAMN
jgi:hypothetical protein